MRPGVSPTTFLCCAICPLNKVKLFAALLFMKISFLREEGGGGGWPPLGEWVSGPEMVVTATKLKIPHPHSARL